MTKRRKPNLSERRQLSPKKSERNNQVALLHVDGLPNYQIAETLKIGVNTVAAILKRTDVQLMIRELRGQINLAIEQAKEELPGKIVQAAAKTLAARFDQLAPRATECMNELMEQGENLTVSLKASQDILNRAEISPKVVLHAETKSESTERRVIIDAAMLRKLHLLATTEDRFINVTPETPELPERFRAMVASDNE